MLYDRESPYTFVSPCDPDMLKNNCHSLHVFDLLGCTYNVLVCSAVYLQQVLVSRLFGMKG